MEKNFQMRKIEIDKNKERVEIKYFPYTKSENVSFKDGQTLQQKEEVTNNHIKNTGIHVTSSEKSKWNSSEQNAKTYAKGLVDGLVNTAPEALDTLKELSNALGNDPNFSTTVMTEIGKKAEKVHKHTKSDITDLPTSLPANGGNSDTVDNLHANAFTRAHSSGYAFGGNQNAITTAQFIELIRAQGAFSQPAWTSRGSWSYATNQYINDTGCGNIHLAGSTIEVIGSSSTHTIRIHTPTTSASGVTHGDFIYINNGSGYTPGWRRLYNTSFKPTASDIGASPVSHNHDGLYLKLSGGILSNTAATRLTLKREGSAANNNLCFDGNGNKNYLGVSNGVLKYGSSEDLNGSGSVIYHSGNKPTPADIGAATTSHGTHVSYGTTTTGLTQGAGGTTGTSTSVSRADHTHTLPSYPTLASLGAAASSHNHTSLTGVTSLGFSSQASDSAIIRTVIDGSNTYFDSYMADDPGTDRFRWRFKPHSTDTALSVERSLMELDCTSASANSAKLTVYGELYSNANKVYHAGNKPVWGDIGSKPSTFAPIVGTASNQAAAGNHTHTQIVSRGKVTMETANTRPSVNGISLSESYNNGYPVPYGNILNLVGGGVSQFLMEWAGNTSTSTGRLYYRSKSDVGATNLSSWAQIYTTAHKPTAVDVGARASNWVPTWNDVSGKPSTFAPIIGSASNQAAAGNHTHTTLGSYAGITNTTNNNGHGFSLYGSATGSAPSYGLMFQGTGAFGTHGSVTGDWATYFTMSGATSRGWIFKSGKEAGGNVASISATGVIVGSDIKVGGNSVYHAGRKPSAADIGAAASNHTHSTLTTPTINNWNDKVASGFYQGEAKANAPESTGWFWGIRIQHGAGYGGQIAIKNGGNRIYFRSQNTDGVGTWSNIYHSNNKPTPADIGAAPASHSHGYMSNGGSYGTITLNDWYRSTGNTGWYNSTHGGGIYMTDSTYVRTSHGKQFYCNNTLWGQRIISETSLEAQNGESRLSLGTYKDPWTGVSCALKCSGNIAATGYARISQHTFKGWAMTNANKYWLGLSGDDSTVRMYDDGSNLQNGVIYLGSSNARWKGIYSSSNLNVSSDSSLKNSIKYIDGRRYVERKRTTLESKEDVLIIPNDCRNFIKNMRFATYFYNSYDTKEILDEEGNFVKREKYQIPSTENDFNIGFIAQDLSEDKVGRAILTQDEDGSLSYNTGSYTTSIAIALQEEINIRDKEILELKNEIKLIKDALGI